MTAPGAAFITGGSSGIGFELARGLAREGRGIALFARGADGLAAAKADLQSECPDCRITTHAVDVGDATALHLAVTDAIAAHDAPAWAIANAGIAEPGLFRDQSFTSFEVQMRTNYFGALAFAKSVVPAMTTGHLLFVGSGAAFFGIYGYSAYAPSKFAMRGLAEVLRVELAPEITVTLAYPPDTDTPQLVAESRTKPSATKEITAGGGLWPPDRVARVILKRARAGKFTATPGPQMSALLALHSLLGPILRAWQIRVAARHRR